MPHSDVDSPGIEVQHHLGEAAVRDSSGQILWDDCGLNAPRGTWEPATFSDGKGLP